MDNEEALRLLDREMDLRAESYADLARRIDTESREYELSGSGGPRRCRDPIPWTGFRRRRLEHFQQRWSARL